MASSACDFDQTELSCNTSDGQKEVGLQMVWILSVSGIRMSGILVGDHLNNFYFYRDVEFSRIRLSRKATTYLSIPEL